MDARSRSQLRARKTGQNRIRLESFNVVRDGSESPAVIAAISPNIDRCASDGNKLAQDGQFRLGSSPFSDQLIGIIEPGRQQPLYPIFERELHQAISKTPIVDVVIRIPTAIL